MKRFHCWSLIFGLLPVAVSLAQTMANPIRLNQVGFYPLAPKVAIVVGGTAENLFYILADNLSDTVYRGHLEASRSSHNSSLHTRSADFSSLSRPGNYFFSISGIGNSYRFSIAENVHRPAAVASLKAFYYQRVSMPLEAKYAGKWARNAGHPDTAVFIHASAATPVRPEGYKISCPGGWYDAGDYNKYVVNAGITMGTLMSAYEDFPDYFGSLQADIPESGNGVPDILNEALYNLRWMLTMQDPSDGGVYHKCTNAAFDGMVMPGITQLPRYVVQKGTAATLDFAAVMSQSARIFSIFGTQFPGLSDSCRKAASLAWDWAILHPATPYDQQELNKHFTPAITTGGYGDNHFSDEWFWAACELFITTGNEKYFRVLKEKLHDTIELPSWNNVTMLGYYSLLRKQKKWINVYPEEFGYVRQQMIQLADRYTKEVGQNAFQTVMGQNKRDFVWGSNAVAANQGILLINAWLATRDKKYIDDALTNIDYILGRNATGYCFLTGMGSRSTLHPHHRPSVADGIEEPVPGLLAGGPNPGMQDHCHYDFIEPETAYSDTDCAYASNEIAINWNAPLVYLLNAMEAMQAEVGYSKKHQ